MLSPVEFEREQILKANVPRKLEATQFDNPHFAPDNSSMLLAS